MDIAGFGLGDRGRYRALGKRRKHGFVTNELLIVFALFSALFMISIPISNRIGWGTIDAFPISVVGFVLVFCLLNSVNIIDQFRSLPAPDGDEKDNGESHDGLA